MRAILATYGTMGDVQPFLALAVELKRRGHAAVLAAPPEFAARAQTIGVEFAALGPPLDLRKTWLAHRGKDAAAQARQVLSWFLPAAPRIAGELEALCEDADALVAFPFLVVASMVHERTKIPYASVSFSPFGVLGSRRLAAETEATNALRTELGLAPVPDPLGADALSPELALFAVSAEVFPRPTAWPAHHRVTGYLFLDEAWTPDDRIASFLAQGEAPIVVSFGSVLHDDPEASTAAVLGAIERTGCRAVVQHGWSGIARSSLPANVVSIDFAPHGWLFPRARCIVHAGGAGTVAAALRAGKPSVVVPHVLDQPIWAGLLHELGCAGPIVPHRALSAVALGDAILETLRDPIYATSAARLGERIRRERGVEDAAEAIEALALRNRQRGTREHE